MLHTFPQMRAKENDRIEREGRSSSNYEFMQSSDPLVRFGGDILYVLLRRPVWWEPDIQLCLSMY